jgi:hypothetical protein
MLDNGHLAQARPLLDRARHLAGRLGDTALLQRADALAEAANAPAPAGPHHPPPDQGRPP